MTLNLPLYNIVINPEDTDTGMFLVSLVDEPAIETDFLAFDKHEKFSFSVQDEDKRIVTGPAIIADMPIYRRTEQGEFYVVFRKDDIPAIVEKFMKAGLSNFINIQHDETTLSNTDAVMVESYFINKERGIVPNEFKDVNDGSWFCSFKILNDDIWQMVKNGEISGFSIEVAGNLELAMEKQKTEEEQMDEEIMTNCFALDPAMAAAINEATKVGTVSVPKENIDLNTFNEASVKYAIDNHKIVMITYNGNSAGGFRQVAISAYGYTSDNNKALRIYEYAGASESGTMEWKIVLWKYIGQFHVVDYLPAWDSNQIGYTGEMGLDGSGFLHGAYEAPFAVL